MQYETSYNHIAKKKEIFSVSCTKDRIVKESSRSLANIDLVTSVTP